jgi:hypothetical protein
MTNREISFIEDTQTPAPSDYAHPVVPSWFLILNEDPVTKNYVRQMRLASELHDKFVRNATAELTCFMERSLLCGVRATTTF